MPNFTLTRRIPDDGAGDSGVMCMKLRLDEATDTLEELSCDYPEVGWALKVGSPAARSYAGQEWWMTSYITEILEETDDDESVRVLFKTGNSTYAWRRFK